MRVSFIVIGLLRNSWNPQKHWPCFFPPQGRSSKLIVAQTYIIQTSYIKLLGYLQISVTFHLEVLQGTRGAVPKARGRENIETRD